MLPELISAPITAGFEEWSTTGLERYVDHRVRKVSSDRTSLRLHNDIFAPIVGAVEKFESLNLAEEVDEVGALVEEGTSTASPDRVISPDFWALKLLSITVELFTRSFTAEINASSSNPRNKESTNKQINRQNTIIGYRRNWKATEQFPRSSEYIPVD